ncbi:tRNA (adenosine(37)-N6)-threonylcarbamoyltransferase complex ATPase subunit type 1 TsaE [Marinicella gelatinilytica]|uniref:tRNA (adenosine(37)-N6)-threonylcarbamoyltransferase complex ATPase subunit type 1 TsaE n=1 Tax=Marinicella gelatinilytica TaxID=2996017 RepID=UPI0022609DF3|nr:tRNA (adenosine(37)-N6)-threonylcarbamoyltransferase complex ATPase subunit type 1 TsaE [Marinicella gelatinilytica]MCX7546198.1 tRNA (adenosine(37)-N6)-threonylcarbamoyltransferase complex ATPase subunit type 1 TsaE [Marinicella gelatinilytica]
MTKERIYNIGDLADLAQLSGQFLNQLSAGDVVFLSGDLGAGKTTFCQLLLQAAGVTEPVKSPTYALYNHYQVDKKSFIHMDLYRLSDPEELYFLDIEWILNGQHIVLVEWPSKGEGILPKPNWRLDFDWKNSQRTLTIT